MFYKKINYLVLFLFCLANTVDGQTYIERDLRLYDVAYNPVTDKLYGACPTSYGFGNSVLIMNPKNGAIESTIPVRTDPHVLRFSTDYQYLYIGYRRWNGLHRYHLDTGELEEVAVFTDANESFGKIRINTYYEYVQGIVAIPGHPEDVVVSLGSGVGNSGSMIYIKGNEMLPNEITNIAGVPGKIHFHEGSGKIYGHGEYLGNSGFGLLECAIDDQGITFLNNYPILDEGRIDTQLEGDYLYTQKGDVIELSSGEPILTGNIYDSINDVTRKGFVVFHPMDGLIYNLEYELFQDYYSLRKFNPDDLSLIEETTVPIALNNSHGKFIPTGASGQFALIIGRKLIINL